MTPFRCRQGSMSSVCQPRCPFRSTARVVTPAVSKHRAEGGCENSPVRSYLHRFLGGRAAPVSEATQARQVRPTGLYHQRPVPFRPPLLSPCGGQKDKMEPKIPSPWRTRSRNSSPSGKGRARELGRRRSREPVPHEWAASASKRRARVPASAARWSPST